MIRLRILMFPSANQIRMIPAKFSLASSLIDGG